MKDLYLPKTRLKILVGVTMSLLGVLIVSAKSEALPQKIGRDIQPAILKPTIGKQQNISLAQIRAALRKIERDQIRWSEVSESIEEKLGGRLRILSYRGPEKNKVDIEVSTNPDSEDPNNDLQFVLKALEGSLIREISKGESDGAPILLSRLEWTLVDRSRQEKVAFGERAELSEVERKDLELAVPKNIEQQSLLHSLERLASKTNVEMEQINFSLGKTLQISLKTSGTPEDMVRFLKMIEVLPRKLIVSRAEFIHEETEGGLELLKATLSLQAFYQKGLIDE